MPLNSTMILKQILSDLGLADEQQRHLICMVAGVGATAKRRTVGPRYQANMERTLRERFGRRDYEWLAAHRLFDTFVAARAQELGGPLHLRSHPNKSVWKKRSTFMR